MWEFGSAGHWSLVREGGVKAQRQTSTEGATSLHTIHTTATQGRPLPSNPSDDLISPPQVPFSDPIHRVIALLHITTIVPAAGPCKPFDRPGHHQSIPATAPIQLSAAITVTKQLQSETIDAGSFRELQYRTDLQSPTTSAPAWKSPTSLRFLRPNSRIDTDLSPSNALSKTTTEVDRAPWARAVAHRTMSRSRRRSTVRP